LAYSDIDLPLGFGRYALRPRDLAKMIQALAPERTSRALEIASGGGYGAAVLARLCAQVVSLEPEPDLARLALSAFPAEAHPPVQVVTTNLQFGWADAAPYDLILVHGGVEFVPPAWLDQLADGGRMAVIVRQGPAGACRLYLKTGGQVSYRTVFDAAPPVLPGLEAPRGFAF
jgi:protein-L-isoaspartate(D-aspartate) O-methyltransferase